MGSVLHWSHIDLEYAAALPRPNTENTLNHQTSSQVSWVDSLPVQYLFPNTKLGNFDLPLFAVDRLPKIWGRESEEGGGGRK